MESTTRAGQYLDNSPGHSVTNTKPQPAKRVQFVSLKIVREAKASVLYPRRQIRCAEDAVELTAPILSDADREHFVVIALDTKHCPNLVQVVSVGTLDASLAHPRDILKLAVVGNASGIICLHNHPSGDPTPSTEDLTVTRRLKDAATLLGIDFLDHIVVGSEGRFTSLKAG